MPEFLIETKRPDGQVGPSYIYITETSELLDAMMRQPVVPPAPNLPVRSAAFAVSKDTPAGKVSPKVLKVSLGLSCNYECEYCSQRFVPRADETNPGEVEGFVAGLDSWVTSPPERIEFWGGEPLVYIKTLRPLLAAMKAKYPEADLSIITNGSLLTPEINDWIVESGLSVGMSHDGPGQHVRGPDPLDDPVKRAAILDLYSRLRPLGKMSFNAMMNRSNMSRTAVVQFFVDLTGDPYVPIGEGAIVDAYDEGGAALSLSSEEESSYRRLSFAELRTGKPRNFSLVPMKVNSFIESIRTRRPLSSVGQKCSMDQPDQIAVDLKGNVLTCQNVSAVSTSPSGESHLIGHVSKLSEVELTTATHWSHRDECSVCPMVHICQGACMFLSGPLWEQTCNNAFSDAVPFFAAGIEVMTGNIPVRIVGPHRADRHDIWNAPAAPRQKIINIQPVAA
jgi:uncharacterized protein